MDDESRTTGSVATSVATAEAPPARPDSHFSWLRTRMSVERTLMSWVRTTFSMISFGFTISQFFEKLQEATVGAAAIRPEAPRNLGLALIATGVLGSLIALVQYHQMVKYLSAEEFRAVGAREGLPLWSLSFAVAIVVTLIGIITLVWIVARG